jgi:hypothetical protein
MVGKPYLTGLVRVARYSTAILSRNFSQKLCH